MSLRNDKAKHRIFVQRLIGTEVDNIRQFLKQLRFQAGLMIDGSFSNEKIKSSLRLAMAELHKTAIDNMVDIAVYEAEFSSKLYKKYFATDIIIPSKASLKKALITDNIAVNNVKLKGKSVLSIDNGATRKSLATAYKQFGQKKADEIARIISDGVINNLAKAEVLLQIESRIAGAHIAQANSLASVAINYTTNIANSQVSDENRAIIEQEIWVRDIEADSCDECESLDGQVGPAGSFESPPIHWGCKCEIVPYVE